jgi:hypothetical protein
MYWLDPDHLPEIAGSVERFLINPHGDADGMILSDCTEVHFPPHLSTELVAAIPRNRSAAVRIRGVRLRAGDLIAAVAIETMDGKRIVDHGPPKKHDDKERADVAKPKRMPMQAEGVVRRALHGPKGELRGALLDDGTIIRLPPHEAGQLFHLIAPGRNLAVRGEGLTSELGTVIEVRQAGPSASELHPLNSKNPKHEKPKHAKPNDHGSTALAQ